MLLTLEQTIKTFSEWIGKLCALLFLLMLCNVFYDVLMRYLFNDVSIGMQELEWHLYASIFLLGASYAISSEAHVRVDLVYERLSPQRKALIDIFGVLIFLIPFTGLVAWYGIDFAKEAYEMGEGSGDPGGLPYRWIIKAMISIAFVSMLISGIGLLLRSINILRGYHLDEKIEKTELV